MIVIKEPEFFKLDTAWKLTTEMVVEMGDGIRFTIPAGFVTDFASSRVGRWEMLSQKASMSLAAVLHDWLYYSNGITRLQADRYFCESMISLGCSVTESTKAYYAVRMFGFLAWRKHRARK